MQHGTVEFWAKSWNNHWPDSCLHSYIYVKEKYHTWDTCLSVNVLYIFILFGSLHFVLITLLKSRMISFQVMSVSVSSCSTPKDLSQSSNIPWLPQIFLNPVSLLFSHSVVSDSLWPHGLQHAGPPSLITSSWSLLKLMSIELVMPSNHLILYHPFLLLLSIFPSIRVFSNKLALHFR